MERFWQDLKAKVFLQTYETLEAMQTQITKSLRAYSHAAIAKLTGFSYFINLLRNGITLDGDDDHAVLDFETFGRPLPNGTEEFTVEAWIYPTTPPDNGNTLLTILHQQVHMLIVNDKSWLNEVANLNVEPPKGNLILIMNAY